uniref:Rieske domain-containing protein n=1 Tax=Esox lucius TaxID=8010 RepID=A0AAY5KDC2_ESOLU
MMEVEVGRHNVLLARSEGMYSATGNQCTHYGAPLSRGVLSGHNVRCPWHGACFNIHTGDLEEYPGMDCLPCHKVGKGRGDKIVRQTKRIKKMVALRLKLCAETLRQQNFGGRIIMVTRDDLLPYDKTRLSKVMNVESDTILLRRMEFFQEYDIEVWLSKEALSMDTEKKTVTFDDGLVQSYDQLLISTGCRAKGLECPGKDLQNVMMLETPEDKDIKFYMNDNVKEVRGNNGKVKEVVLKSGTVFPADVLIVGIGVIPNAEFLQSTPIVMDSRNFVIVDKYMRTNVPDVFCGGDLATFPLTMAKNQMVNIGHWQMAQAHGRIAALNMLEKNTELNSIPYYWTVLLGKNIRYAGYGEGYTDIVIKGRVEEQKFLAFYIKNGEVIAAASLNYDPAVSAVAERLATGNVITKEEAESNDLSWLKMKLS